MAGLFGVASPTMSHLISKLSGPITNNKDTPVSENSENLEAHSQEPGTNASQIFYYTAVVFSFSLSSKYFLISLQTSLTHVFFRSVLFDLQIFQNSLAVFLLLISTLIPFWSESILMISILLHC